MGREECRWRSNTLPVMLPLANHKPAARPPGAVSPLMPRPVPRPVTYIQQARRSRFVIAHGLVSASELIRQDGCRTNAVQPRKRAPCYSQRCRP